MNRVRSALWLSAEALGENDEFARVWLHLHDGQVRVFRLQASCLGRDDVLAPLVAASLADARGLLLEVNDPAFGWAIAVYAAPVVPLLRAGRWSPAHSGALSFGRGLDAEVLEALGQLDAQRTWGSARNYTRLAILPPEQRQRRLQAITRFPLLVAPVLLTAHHQLECGGGKRHAWRAHDDAVIEAIDRGRDLVGVLAAHHGISRGLVRGPLCRQMGGSTAMPHDEFLRLMDALTPEQRPAGWGEIDLYVPALPALESLVGGRERLTAAAHDIFRRGWTPVWRACADAFTPLPAAVSDAEDFLRAAVTHAGPDAGVTHTMLGLAWLRERGLRSLLRASARWHAAPRATVRADGREETLPDVLGTLLLGDATARELLTPSALADEGDAMHHCVGDYWGMCEDDGARVMALSLQDGERGTALYVVQDLVGRTPQYALRKLRGRGNTASSAAMQALAVRVLESINDSFRDGALARAWEHATCRRRAVGRWERRPAGPLGLAEERELAVVLARHRARPENRPLPGEIVRIHVAGLAHHGGAGVSARLLPGGTLSLVREADNPHDPLAVRIAGAGTTLGYVPRADNASLAARLDGGQALSARIVAFDREAPPWRRLLVAVCVAADASAGA